MCLNKIVSVLRAVSGSPNPKNFTSAVIAAAGSGTRFGGETTKQLIEVAGAPIIVHTLRAFEAAECIHEIIIVARRDEIPVIGELCEKNGFKKIAKILPGGYSRQDSVLIGTDAVSKASKFVAIADGARCLITPEQISEVCRAAYKYKAATAAQAVTDTVKIADAKGFIESTADRNTVFLAQTPQVFKTKLYRAAAYTALKKNFQATNDNMLVEFVKHPVRLVECGKYNFKITTREDAFLAEAILQKRQNEAASVLTGEPQ